MKILKIRTAGLVPFLVVLMTSPLQAENLYPDPSLEEGYIEPLGWRSSAGEGLTWSDTVARSGKRSMEIAGSEDPGIWSCRLPVKAGRQYRFSCYLKTDGVPADDGGYLDLAWTRKGAVIDNDWGYPRKQSAKVNGTEWQQVSITSQSDGADVDGVQISFVGSRSGTVWADDFAVEDLREAETHDGRWYEMEDGFFELDAAPESPHIKWANPGAGEAPRVLFIYPIATGREIVETSRRFEIDYELAYVCGYKDLGPTNFINRGDERYREERVLQNMRDKLALDYDIIVIGMVKWMSLPEDVRDAILQKVKGGTGMFYSYNRTYNGEFETSVLGDVKDVKPAQHNLRGKIPWPSIPVDENIDSVKEIGVDHYAYGTLGKGRIVTFHTDPYYHQFMTPRLSHDEMYVPLYYEYFQAYVGHLLSWLARTPATATIESVTIDEVYSQSAINGSNATVTINSTLQAAGQLICTIRSDAEASLTAEYVDTVEVSIQPGEQGVSVKLPFLKTGKHC